MLSGRVFIKVSRGSCDGTGAFKISYTVILKKVFNFFWSTLISFLLEFKCLYIILHTSFGPLLHGDFPRNLFSFVLITCVGLFLISYNACRYSLVLLDVLFVELDFRDVAESGYLVLSTMVMSVLVIFVFQWNMFIQEHID